MIRVNVTITAADESEAALVLTSIADLVMSGYERGSGKGEFLGGKFVFTVTEEVSK